jgi:hypothetical protein
VHFSFYSYFAVKLLESITSHASYQFVVKNDETEEILFLRVLNWDTLVKVGHLENTFKVDDDWIKGKLNIIQLKLFKFTMLLVIRVGYNQE